MPLVQKRSNSRQKDATNPPDWSALIPVLPARGPRTRELYGALRRLIESGRVPPGAKLPTTRDLARRLGLSRAAAVAAFETLIAEGFATARVGAGTFVAAQVPLVGAAPVRAAAPNPWLHPPPPGALGVAAADPRTMAVFRRLLSRHLARPDAAHFRYGDPRGGIALRRAIAAYLRTARGVRCDPDQIIVTSGTQQGLDLLLRALIRPGDAAWIEDPGYPRAQAALAAAGARLIGVPVDAEGLDPAQGAVLGPEARLVYVTPSHQFPLGVTLSMPRRLALLDWARRHDAWIVEDDYDSEFRYAGPPLTALQGLDDGGRVAYLGTFAKVLFPGLRVGYLVLPDALLAPVLAQRIQADKQPPTLAEGALADLLDHGHFAAHLRRARLRALAGRDALVAGLRARCGDALTVVAPAQGLHLVARLTGALADTEVEAVAAAHGIGLRALSPMYRDAIPVSGLVLGFSGFAADALRDAAARLGEILT
jgi:GntR family transcriptional regulator/MocR family aminotransferase